MAAIVIIASLLLQIEARCGQCRPDDASCTIGTPVRDTALPLLLQTKATQSVSMRMPASEFFEEDAVVAPPEQAPNVALHDVGSGAVPVLIPEESAQPLLLKPPATAASLLQGRGSTYAAAAADADRQSASAGLLAALAAGREAAGSADVAAGAAGSDFAAAVAGGREAGGSADFVAALAGGKQAESAAEETSSDPAAGTDGHSMSDQKLKEPSDPKESGDTGEEGELLDEHRGVRNMSFANKPEEWLASDRRLLQGQRELDELTEATKQALTRLKAQTYQSADYARWRISEQAAAGGVRKPEEEGESVTKKPKEKVVDDTDASSQNEEKPKKNVVDDDTEDTSSEKPTEKVVDRTDNDVKEKRKPKEGVDNNDAEKEKKPKQKVVDESNEVSDKPKNENSADVGNADKSSNEEGEKVEEGSTSQKQPKGTAGGTRIIDNGSDGIEEAIARQEERNEEGPDSGKKETVVNENENEGELEGENEEGGSGENNYFNDDEQEVVATHAGSEEEQTVGVEAREWATVDPPRLVPDITLAPKHVHKRSVTSAPVTAAPLTLAPTVPPVRKKVVPVSKPKLGPPHGGHCTPTCKWSCDNPKCDEVCEPVCQPPKCETRCQGPSTDGCSMECAKPHCAVVCPKSLCPSGGCPVCSTQCSEPVCKLQCPQTQPCETVCEQPQCEWRCRAPSNCPKPKCKMMCETPTKCQTSSFKKELPPLQDDQVAVQTFRAPSRVQAQSRSQEMAAKAREVEAETEPANMINVHVWHTEPHTRRQRHRLVSMPVL